MIPVWNALKTSRKVLGADMPMADEAQQFEMRVEEVLSQGVGAAEKLLTRNGTQLTLRDVGYIKDSVERCR